MHAIVAPFVRGLLLGSVALACGACCSRGATSGNPDPAGQPAAPARVTPSATATAPVRSAAPVQSAAQKAEPPAPGKSERVRFKAGATGAEIKDSVIRGERNRYLIGASKGQTMSVSISSLEDNATFSVIGADGKVIRGTEESRDLKHWTGTLPASGDTIISVGPTRGNATFTLDVDVSAKGGSQCSGDMANSELPCNLKDGRWGWCKGGACKDICPAGYSYHPNASRCHQRRDCKAGMGDDGIPVKTAQCNECLGVHCLDPGATRDVR